MTNRFPTILTLFCLCALPTSLFAQSYNVYFGDIHTQTWYSDGNQDQNELTYTVPVARAITYARDMANDMDFLGISDHNHNESLNMTMARWLAGNQEADSMNQDGVFVGMRGQEWGTISGGGHVLVYGTDKLFGWNPGVYQVYVQKSNYAMLYDSMAKYGGFGYLAHPQSDDYSGLFSSPYNAKADSVIKGLSMRNGPATSTNTSETNPSGSTYESRFHDLLIRGYHVAPIENQDNHNTTFGRVNQQRTAVLATSLTRANIVDALRNRRVYATDDHNLQLRFEVGTHQMGEVFTNGGAIPFRVKVVDPDNTVNSIVLRHGVPGSMSLPTTLTSTSGSDSLVYSYSQPIGTTYYYYALVTMNGGRMAWSAPMWITIPTGPIPQAFTLSLPSNSSGNQAIGGTLSWQTSTNATQYDVYLGTTNPPTTLVSGNQTDTTYNYSGLLNNTPYWWKIVAKNVNGTTVASGAPWTFTTIVAAPSAFGQTSPANSATNQAVSGTLSWQVSPNAAQYDVYLDTNTVPTTLVSAGQAGTTYNYSGLFNTKDYYWKVVANNVAGSLDATGAPWTFKTVGPSPGAFALDAPPNSAVSQPLAGLLIWNTSADAALYDVYLDVVNPPTVRIDSNLVDTSYSYAGLLPGQLYYWKVIAKNENATTLASDAPHSFTTVNVPDAASDAVASNVTVASMHLSWTDNAGDETGYRLYRSLASSGPFVQVGSDLPVDAQEFNDSGLALNTEYHYRIVPFNGIGEGNYLAVHASTLAVIPGEPVMSGVTYTAATVTIDPSTNPAETEFAIQAKENTIAAGYVQANGKLGGGPVWRTLADWGGGTGSVVSGLHSCYTYSFGVVARNHDNVQTSASVEASGTLPCFSISQNTSTGWNLFSMPVIVPNPTKAAVFPGSASSAFFYQGSYQKRDTLPYGVGFWIKYNGAVPVEFAGEPITDDSISVTSGWNLIGALSEPVSASSIVSTPPSIVVSNYFGYNGSYFAAESLMAMQGYWVKASSAGSLVISSAGQVPAAMSKIKIADASTDEISLIIEDAANHRQTLKLVTGSNQAKQSSELPPLPPNGAFDVRFEGGGNLISLGPSAEQRTRRIGVAIQSTDPILHISREDKESDIIDLKVELNGTLQPLPAGGGIEFMNPDGAMYLVASLQGSPQKPRSTALHQNYPNPFNPTTRIQFDLANPSRVTIKVYDIIGREVASLLDNELLESGSREITFDASGIASGVYVYRMLSTSLSENGNANGDPVLLTRKMILQR